MGAQINEIEITNVHQRYLERKKGSNFAASKQVNQFHNGFVLQKKVWYCVSVE